MKRLILLLIVLTVAMTVFVACGEGETTSSTETDNTLASTTTTATKPDVQTEPVVEVMDNIDVETEGYEYNNVEEDLNGKVGSINSAASFVAFNVSGNYDGVYELTVWYTSQKARWMCVQVNGLSHKILTPEVTSSWDDVSTAKAFTLQVQLKNGDNDIIFTAFDGAAPNLVDFDLKLLYTTDNSKAIEIASPEATDNMGNWEFKGGVSINACNSGFGTYLGSLNKTNSATYTLKDQPAGEYLLAVYYINNDNPRGLKVVVNDKSFETSSLRTGAWGNASEALPFYCPITLAEGENTFTLSGVNSNAPDVYKLVLIPLHFKGL